MIQINPPEGPFCSCCGRHLNELPVWDFNGHMVKIVKDYRDEGNGQVGHYWVCGFCLGLSDKQFFKLLRTDKTTLSFAEWMQMYCFTELSISKKHLALYRKLCKDLWACPNCGRINTDRDLLCACMLERIGP